MKKLLFALLIVTITLSSCLVIGGSKKIKLTEEKMQNYLGVYTKLREEAPDILETINKDPKNSDIGQEAYENIRSIIKDGGLDSYAEFVMLNAKIGAVFSVLQAQKGMSTFENLNTSSNDMIEKSINEIQKNIDDPNVPEETKAELRKQIEELKEQQEQLNTTYEQNKKIANLTLKAVQKISGLVVNKDEIAIVQKYEKELMRAYVGFQLPELPDGKLPDLNFEDYD